MTLLKPAFCTPITRARHAALLSLVAVAAGACGGGSGSSTPPTETGPRLDVQAMILVGEAGDTIYSHQDHWHGFPVVPEAGRARYAVYFTARAASSDDHLMPPRADWFTLAPHADAALTATVEQPATAGWEGDRLTGALVGRQAGASRVNFVVKRGTTTLREAPPLPFTVR
jgi:hypothetical protein